MISDDPPWQALLYCPAGVCGSDDSAAIKQVLKHEPCTDDVTRLAAIHYIEAGEALNEGASTDPPRCSDSWVARTL